MLTTGIQYHRQDTIYFPDCSLKGKFPDKHLILNFILRQHSEGSQNPDGNRQVQSAAVLPQIGRRQVDRNPVLWKRKA